MPKKRKIIKKISDNKKSSLPVGQLSKYLKLSYQAL
jgi:hypothetical protein